MVYNGHPWQNKNVSSIWIFPPDKYTVINTDANGNLESDAIVY